MTQTNFARKFGTYFILYPLGIVLLINLSLQTYSMYIEQSTTGKISNNQLYQLLMKIVDVIDRSVQGYFSTFVTCWQATLNAMVIMINNYILLLKHVTEHLTKFPNVIFTSIAAIFAMFFGYLMLNSVIKCLRPTKTYQDETDLIENQTQGYDTIPQIEKNEV